MSKIFLSKSDFLALIFLFLITLGMIFLGFWQLDRANERRSILEKIDIANNLNTIILSEYTPYEQLNPWRNAKATGRWLLNKSILIENRNYKGIPGYWLGTPLLIDEKYSIFVLRGWFPRTIPDKTESFLPTNNLDVEITIKGKIVLNVPRLFELPFNKSKEESKSFVSEKNKIFPILQNFEIKDYSEFLGMPFLPVILQQTSEDKDLLIRDWNLPSTNFHKNIGYAIQWFSLAFVSFIFFIIFMKKIKDTRYKSFFPK
ncbi:MAG: SURF1 family protein [Bordetella sp.]|nr:MAG: SURF1 family protein [Bordetella sp.]